MVRTKHPFLWGAATSAHQVEGNNKFNDWWAWEESGNCEGGVRSGRASDHWRHFIEDLDIAKELGLNTYRFSIEWSRIEPHEGHFDTSAVEWYKTLINECSKQDLIPMVTLHHFTSPKWFCDKGGFTHEDSPEFFKRFVEHILEELGAEVPLWCTLNEPVVLTVGGYLGKFMPPGVFSTLEASKVFANLFKCHVIAYDLIHKKLKGKRTGKWAQLPLMVGIAHNMIDFLPSNKWHPLEVLAAQVFHRFYNLAWLNAITGKKQKFGITGFIPNSPQYKMALNRVTCDFIGVNYYTKGIISWGIHKKERERADQLPFTLQFAEKDEESSDLDWSIHPKGFEKIIKAAASYGLPIVITENGIADKTDLLRLKYLEQHLAVIKKLKHEGLDIRGYYHWSLIDNFEWIKGFGPRFGLARVDYNNFKRSINSSGFFYRQWISQNNS